MADTRIVDADGVHYPHYAWGSARIGCLTGAREVESPGPTSALEASREVMLGVGNVHVLLTLCGSATEDEPHDETPNPLAEFYEIAPRGQLVETFVRGIVLFPWRYPRTFMPFASEFMDLHVSPCEFLDEFFPSYHQAAVFTVSRVRQAILGRFFHELDGLGEVSPSGYADAVWKLAAEQLAEIPAIVENGAGVTADNADRLYRLLLWESDRLRQRKFAPLLPGEVFIPTKLQAPILEALNERALNSQALADEVTGGDKRRLYKKNRKGDLHELMDLGFVEHKDGVGYFRRDAPPDSAIRPAGR